MRVERGVLARRGFLRGHVPCVCLGGRRLRVDPRADAELPDDLAHMSLDSAGSDEEPGCDLRVRETLAGQPRDLLLLSVQDKTITMPGLLAP
jgi:hypothetical protein